MGMFLDYEPDQAYLLPPSPRDWLPEDHLVWFISETVDELDLGSILESYRAGGKGQLSYHPRMMLKVLIYGYSVGVFSSRKIAKQIEENVAFRVLCGGQMPNHRTICRFRETHLGQFEALFVQVVRLALASGVAKMGTLVIDGSKVKANASKHKAMSYERMQKEEKRLGAEIRKLTRMAKDQDAVEDEEFGPDFRGDELPEELKRRKSRIATIRAAKVRLESRKAAEAQESKQGKKSDRGGGGSGGGGAQSGEAPPKPKDQENFTDPDSRIMKTSNGFQQSYNAQIAVEDEGRIIVAAKICQCASDANELLPMVDEAQSNTGAEPRSVLADAGYKSETNFKALEKRDLRAYVAVGREGKAPSAKASNEATLRMRRRVRSKRGREKYKSRKHIVEPVFGWVKQALGFRSFSVRGVGKVQGEWSLVCLSTNLKRMSAMMTWQ